MIGRAFVLATVLVGCRAPSPPPVAPAPAPPVATTEPASSSSVAAIPPPQPEPAASPPSAEPTPPGAEPAAANGPGDSVVAKLRPRFKSCYALGLAKDPSMTGNMKVTLIVDAQGKVTSAKVVCSTLPKPVTECLRAVYLSAQFEGGPATSTVGGPC